MNRLLQTHRRRSLACAGACAALVLSATRIAEAQPQPSDGVYVSGSALAEVKRFSGDPTANILDGEAFGGAVALGTSLGARWDVEVGVDVPRVTAGTQSRSVTLRRTMITLEPRTRSRIVSVATLIRFRGARRGRVQLGYLGGVSFVRLRRRIDTEAPAGTPPSLISRPFEQVDYGVAPTVGVDAQIAIAAHLSVVPAMRVAAFDFTDGSAVLLSPRIGVRWTF